MEHKTRIGIVGCGDICGIYIKNLQQMEEVEIVACSARTFSHAEVVAERYSIPRAMDTDSLLQDEDIDLVLNLTTPKSHYEISRRALENGKHVYSEKPLALSLEEGRELLSLSKKYDLYLGCAPDTFLGSGFQTGLKLINEGQIGKPLSATAFIAWHGPEREHPNPAFLYQNGAGPVFDYGPYYLTSLVKLLGPAESVCSMAGKGFEYRTVSCPGPNQGARVPVEISTHTTSMIRFQNGAIVTLIFSFDIWGHNLPFMEIYGTKGSLSLPDPDTFGGPVRVLKEEETEFQSIPLIPGREDNGRGIGVQDMIHAIRNKTSFQASGETALHVLEIMCAIAESAEKSEYVYLSSDQN